MLTEGSRNILEVSLRVKLPTGKSAEEHSPSTEIARGLFKLKIVMSSSKNEKPLEANGSCVASKNWIDDLARVATAAGCKCTYSGGETFVPIVIFFRLNHHHSVKFTQSLSDKLKCNTRFINGKQQHKTN